MAARSRKLLFPFRRLGRVGFFLPFFFVRLNRRRAIQLTSCYQRVFTAQKWRLASSPVLRSAPTRHRASPFSFLFTSLFLFLLFLPLYRDLPENRDASARMPEVRIWKPLYALDTIASRGESLLPATLFADRDEAFLSRSLSVSVLSSTAFSRAKRRKKL